MENEQMINHQRRVFIIALGTPRMLHARLPGGIIDRGQHCDACFWSQGGRRDGYGTLANTHHWMAVPIIPAAGGGYEQFTRHTRVGRRALVPVKM